MNWKKHNFIYSLNSFIHLFIQISHMHEKIVKNLVREREKSREEFGDIDKSTHGEGLTIYTEKERQPITFLVTLNSPNTSQLSKTIVLDLRSLLCMCVCVCEIVQKTPPAKSQCNYGDDRIFFFLLSFRES